MRIENSRPGKIERRKTPRTSVRKLAYVNFEPYNIGGVITEISASGLGFHTVAPLQQGGTLRFSLVFSGMKQLESVGEIVWTDSSRKIGGVRFVVLPSNAADEITKWLTNSASANSSQIGAESEASLVSAPDTLIPVTSFEEPEKARTPAAASPVVPQLSDAPIGTVLGPRGWVVPDKSKTILSTTQLGHDLPQQRSLVGTVAVCLLLAAMVWFGTWRYSWLSIWIRHANPIASEPVAATPEPTLAGGVLPGLDASNSGETNSYAANPAEETTLNTVNPVPPREQAVPLPSPNPPAANPKATVTESPEAAIPGRIGTEQSPSENRPLAPASPNSLIPSSQHVAENPASSAPPPATDPGETELIVAWQYLEGQGGRPRDPVAAARLLWTAVEKGSLSAETTLANLYLRGEGVPKSCDQALVLLSAASHKGSFEAKRKLRELNQTGCR